MYVAQSYMLFTCVHVDNMMYEHDTAGTLVWTWHKLSIIIEITKITKIISIYNNEKHVFLTMAIMIDHNYINVSNTDTWFKKIIAII